MKKNVFIIIILGVIVFGLGMTYTFGLFYNPETPEPKSDKDTQEEDIPEMMSIDEGLRIAEQYKLESSEVIEYSSFLKTDGDECLVFDSDIASYKIQASDGSLLSLYRKDIESSDDISVTIQEAENIAREAVAKYRKDFDLDQMTQTIAELQESKNDNRYVFEWRLYKKGVDIGHTIWVEVTGTGQFKAFMCNSNIDFEPDLSKVKFTAEEIKELSIQFLKSYLSDEKARNLTAGEPELVIGEEESICWLIELTTYETDANNPDLPPDEYYYLLKINAETGEIVENLSG